MSLINKIKSMVSSSSNNNDFTDKKEENIDFFLNTLVVYNSKRKLIILVSYTQNYFNDVIEFLTACQRVNIKYATQQSAYTESSNNIEDDDYSLKPLIKHRRYYLLISGEIDRYISIYKNIDLENAILKAISKEIYNCRAGVTFKELIDIGVLENNFLSNVQAKYDNPRTVFYENIDEISTNIEYDDIIKIRDNIPACFTIIDLTYLIDFYEDNPTNKSKPIPLSIREVISLGKQMREKHPHRRSPSVEVLINAFTDTKFIKEPITEEIIFSLINPKYMQIDDEDMIGNLADDQLDQIFREQYEKFSAIYNPMMEFTSIDEEISRDIEPENEEMEDTTNDYT